jgi:hypothetical protein
MNNTTENNTKGGFDNPYIAERTREYIECALNEGRIVDSDTFEANDGTHPESDCDLETPASFMEDMMSTWTLDMELSDEREEEIASLVRGAMEELLPEHLVADLY